MSSAIMTLLFTGLLAFGQSSPAVAPVETSSVETASGAPVASVKDAAPELVSPSTEELAVAPAPESEKTAFSIRREDVDYFAGHFGAARKLAHPSWARDSDGKVEGVRLRKIAEDGLLYQAGFRNGDLVKSVNEKPVTSIPQALGALHKVKKADLLEIDVRRKNGEAVTLRVTIS
jgi:hypothetical protein